MRINYDDLDFSEDYLVCQWQGRPFTGTAYETDAGGALTSEVDFENGFRNGIAREWAPCGQLKSESHYQRGSKHGVSRVWHDNARIKLEAEYELGIQIKKREWDQDGELVKQFELDKHDPMFSILVQLRQGQHLYVDEHLGPRANGGPDQT